MNVGGITSERGRNIAADISVANRRRPRSNATVLAIVGGHNTGSASDLAKIIQ